MEIRQAEVKFHLADGQPDLASRGAGDLLSYLERFHLKHFQSDALLLKAKACLALNRPREAHEILSEACRWADQLSTQPVLWQILDSQATALERLGEPEQTASKRDRARVILTTLAGSIAEESDRRTFLNLPDVRRLLVEQG